MLDKTGTTSVRYNTKRHYRYRANEGKYRLNERFGQGSCGEVWRAHLTTSGTSSHEESGGGDKDSHGQVPKMYILKRIFVERGEHVRLSGLREVFFGLRLRGKTHVARFVEYFEIVSVAPGANAKASSGGTGKAANDSVPVAQRELWLVFHDEGSSLHSTCTHRQAIFLFSPRPFGSICEWVVHRAWQYSVKLCFKFFSG